MNLIEKPDGWWIASPAIDQGGAGAYRTEKEAAEDRRGLAAFFREHPDYRADSTKPEEATDEPEPFTLTAPTPAPPKPKREEVFTPKAQQKALFTGLDCQPGQLDLFRTDGGLGGNGS